MQAIFKHEEIKNNFALSWAPKASVMCHELTKKGVPLLPSK